MRNCNVADMANMIKIVSLLFITSFAFADTLPLPQLNPQSGKWEYVDDGKASAQTRLAAKSEDEKNAIPDNIFESQKGINLSEYGRLSRLSVSIGGGTMEFFGKKRRYAPIQKMITLGESGALKVYCDEPSCRDFAPELLYYSYRVNNGSLELFLDTVANTPIRVKVDNSLSKKNKIFDSLSVNPQNSKLKPSNITLQMMGVN